MSSTLGIHRVKRIAYIAPFEHSHNGGEPPSFILQRILIEDELNNVYWIDLYVTGDTPVTVENFDTFGEFFNGK